MLIVVRVSIPFVQDNGLPAKEGQRMILKRASYLRYRGLDYIGRLCVRDKIGGREYLRFIEQPDLTCLPHDPGSVLIYKGGCCVDAKPDSMVTEVAHPTDRQVRLSQYGESLRRFYQERASLAESERLAQEAALASARLHLNTGCRGCKKKMARLEEEIRAVERTARRQAGVAADSEVESAGTFKG